MNPDRHTPHVTRLLLSGGSHRAALGSAGVLAYLTESGRLQYIEDVISVSGSSMTNAALMVDPPVTDADVYRVLGAFIDRVARDRGRVLASWARVGLLAALIALLSSVVVAITWVIAAGPSSAWGRLLAILVALMIVPAVLMVGRRIVSRALRESVVRAVGSSGGELFVGEPAFERSRAVVGEDRRTWNVSRQVIAATGHTTGSTYAFQFGGAKAGPRVLADGYTPSVAAYASASLPPLGFVRSPKSNGGEYLVDGGASGGFGDQYVEQDPTDSEDSPSLAPAETLYVDAMRHLQPSRVQRLYGFSALYTMARWISASVEATYRNDLIDASPRRIVRLCDGHYISRGVLDIRRQAGADNMTWGPSSPAGLLLDGLRTRVAGINLRGFSAADAHAAVACGILSTAEAFGELGTIAESQRLLHRIGDALKLDALCSVFGPAVDEYGWAGHDLNSCGKLAEAEAGPPSIQPIQLLVDVMYPTDAHRATRIPRDVSVVWAAPRPAGEIFNPEPEKNAVVKALELGDGKLTSVPDASLAELATVAKSLPESIVHIAGVTRPKLGSNDASLMFERDDGTGQAETGEMISKRLAEAQPRCLIISASDSAELIRDVTACAAIGFAGASSDMTAKHFSELFYGVIAGSETPLTVDQAVMEVRKALVDTSVPETFQSSVDRIGQRLSGQLLNVRDQLSGEGTWLSMGPRQDVFLAKAPRIGANDFTVLAWIRRNGVDDTAYFADTRADETSPGWAVGGYQGRLLLQIHRGGDIANTDYFNYYQLTGRPIFDGEWHLVAAAVDRDGRFELSVDGDLDVGGIVSLQDVDLTGTALLIGTALQYRSTPGLHFNGDLADLAVINRVVTLTELAELTAIGPSGVEDW